MIQAIHLQHVMLLFVVKITVYRITCVIWKNTGTYINQGDDVNGPDTYCQPVLCDENEYVFNKERLACPPGTYNAPGDDAIVWTQHVMLTICSENYRVSNHTCVICEQGTYNAQEMMQVGQIHIASQYCAMKMNMFLIIRAKRPQGYIMPLEILLMKRTPFVMLWLAKLVKITVYQICLCNMRPWYL